jgi:dTDP-4-amino-4,6-dideoxygalactose transaminase
MKLASARQPNAVISPTIDEIAQDFSDSELGTPTIPSYRIRYVVPDLPSADEILPYLRQIDEFHWYSNFGPLEQAFRARTAETFFPGLTAQNIITASSGALAIETALIAHDFPLGARVLMPSFTFVATAAAVVRAGCVPIFADVDPDTLALDPARAGYLARILGCSAVVPVGVAGMGLPTVVWEAFAEETGIAVVVDAAGALGNQCMSPQLTLAFSLHATKPFGIGEGGLVVSTREHVISKARVATNFGLEDGKGTICGTNAKMSEYHAAVGLSQLKRLRTISGRRTRVLETYAKLMLPLAPRVRILTPLENNPANLIVMFSKPIVSKLVARLSGVGIESRRLYLPPVHRHPAYVGYDCAEPLIHSERLWTHSLSLPCHGALTEKDVAEIVSLISSSID